MLEALTRLAQAVTLLACELGALAVLFSFVALASHGTESYHLADIGLKAMLVVVLSVTGVIRLERRIHAGDHRAE